MARETEIKVTVRSLEDFLTRLRDMTPLLVSSRHFEDNFLMDYPDSSLRSQGCMLRVRVTAQRAFITHKGPVQPSSHFKIREERETAVESGRVALEIFQQLGLRVWFRYQKYRQEYDIPLRSEPGLSLRVALDETPVGIFAEFEGAEEGIRDAARRMGYGDAEFLRDSYYGLYLQYCRKTGCEPSHMVFPGEAP